MTAGHRGRLFIPGDDRPLPVEVAFTDRFLKVKASDTEVGSWRYDDCRVTPSEGRFRIDLIDEEAWFEPADPEAFAVHVDEHWPSLAKAVKTLPPEAMVVEEPEAPTNFKEWWQAVPPAGRVRVVAVLAGMLAFVALLLAVCDTSPAPTPETIVVTAPPPAPSVFTLTMSDAIQRWNETATNLGINLFVTELPEGPLLIAPLTDYLTLYASSERDTGLLRTMMLGTDPVVGDDAQVVLGAWGVLMTVADPSLTPEGRRFLLGQLQVDPEAPLVMGLDETAVAGPVRFWLQSGLYHDQVDLGFEVEGA
jgi:hypothetical protein